METRKLDVTQVIDNSRMGGFQYGIFVLCGLCLLMDGFDVQSMGYVAPEIIREWKVSAQAMGRVLAAAPIGVLIGSLLFSMIADKVGRRPVLIGVTLYFAVLTLATAFAGSRDQLLIIRLVAGIGLGGIMPNAVSLCGEYAPKTSRVTVMMVVGNCFSVGAAVGGFIAAWLIPRFGWRSVFIFGGIVPLIISLMMLMLLPESLQYLAMRGKDLANLRKWLGKLAPEAGVTASTQFVTPERPKGSVPMIELFREGRAVGTLGLWVINFMNLLNLYFLASWLPTVVRDAGFSQQTSVLVGATLQLAGAIATFVLGWGVHKIGFVPVLSTGFAIGAVNIYMIGQPGITVLMLYIVVGLAGVGVVGGQSGVNAFAATFYPTETRATGVGAGLGIGRTGAIVGPLIAGYLIGGLHWTNDKLFLTAAVPALISAIVMFSMRWVVKKRAMAAKVEPVAVH